MAHNAIAKDAQRLDKWLWHARIVKTRSLAAQLVAEGKCRVNREKILKPAHSVKCGDVITATVFGRVRVLQIARISGRREPPREAQTLYVELMAQTSTPSARPIVPPETSEHPVQSEKPA